MRQKSQLEPKDNCLMLKDTTLEVLPSNLEKLFNNFQLKTLTIADICYQLVYLVALETGFAETNAFAQCAKGLYDHFILTSFYDAQNVRSLVQVKPTMKRHEGGLHYCMRLRSIVDNEYLEMIDLDGDAVSILMTAIVTGDFIIVSLTPVLKKQPGNLDCTRSICLSIPRYVVSVFDKKTLNECLQNLDELTRKLRDELFLPVRNYHLSILDIEIYPNLAALPYETYEEIFKYLDNRQLQNLAKVNTLFAELLSRNTPTESASSLTSQDFPRIILSSFFEMEPYYQIT